MTALDLFSGIGGFSLAAHRAGLEVVAHCEIEPFPQAVLGYRFPNIPIFRDVKEITKETFYERTGRRTVDVVSDWNKPTRKFVCSIVNWEDEDVWEFIRLRKLPYCELYDKGYKRLGCLNCPMQTAKRRRAEMKRYPRFENAFIKTAELTWEKWHNHINKNGKPHISSRFKSGKQWYEWWCSDLGIEAYFQEDCQMELMFVGTDESEAV